jgi:cytoskeletal protein CcmA (bactofilin family)
MKKVGVVFLSMFVLFFVLGVLSIDADELHDIIRVEALIDGRSQLTLSGSTAQWDHFHFHLPGKADGRDEPTIINGIDWFPIWAGDCSTCVLNVDPDCSTCSSNMFNSVVPNLPLEAMTVDLKIIESRDQVSLVQLPDSSNSYTLIIEFDDNLPPGAEWYIVDIYYTQLLEALDCSIIAGDSLDISFRGKVRGTKCVASHGGIILRNYASIEGLTVSNEMIELLSDAKVLNSIITNDSIKTLQRCRIYGNVNAATNVKLKRNTRVHGNVIAGGNIILDFRASIDGYEMPNDTPINVIIPPLPTCNADLPGTDDLVTPPYSGPHIVPTLPTGLHRDYTYANNNKVVFKGGIYTFRHLIFGSKTVIEFLGPTIIHINGSLTFQDNINQILSNGTIPEDIVYIIAPNAPADIGTNSAISGTFCAPNSKVEIMNKASLTGAVYAQEVKAGKYSTIFSAPAALP